MTRRDFAVLAVGILIGVSVGASVALATSRDQANPSGGRFQGFAVGDHQAFVILDTSTGHAWARADGGIVDYGTPEMPKPVSRQAVR